MDQNQIPGWCFLSGQFLTQFEKNKKKQHYNEVHNKFLNHIISEPKLNDFNYTNPGVVLMLCYGLIVYPYELLEKNSKSDNDIINAQIVQTAKDLDLEIDTANDLFEEFKIKRPCDASELLKLLRHAISHAHVRVNIEEIPNTFTFWNVNPNTKKKDFETTISVENLSVLLTGVGKYFFNIKSKQNVE